MPQSKKAPLEERRRLIRQLIDADRMPILTTRRKPDERRCGSSI
tara:strand:- start:60 stop:191 length:132 start_codon:yes stop_codon:yes gene_type:complete